MDQTHFTCRGSWVEGPTLRLLRPHYMEADVRLAIMSTT